MAWVTVRLSVPVESSVTVELSVTVGSPVPVELPARGFCHGHRDGGVATFATVTIGGSFAGGGFDGGGVGDGELHKQLAGRGRGRE